MEALITVNNRVFLDNEEKLKNPKRRFDKIAGTSGEDDAENVDVGNSDDENSAENADAAIFRGGKDVFP